MTLRQRRTPFDKFLLQVVFPAVHGSRLRPLMCVARVWHQPAVVERQTQPELTFASTQAEQRGVGQLVPAYAEAA